MFFSLWPWWLGAMALAIVAAGSLLVLGRPIGVSGTIARALDLEARRNEREAVVASDEALLEAMLAAAAAEAGDALPDDLDDESDNADESDERAESSADPITGPSLNWSESVLLLVGIAGGGLLAALLGGRVGAPLDATALALFGDGVGIWLALFGGGVLVGFGTQMGGGCTSGHGLAGCGSFQPGSLVATAIFFGTGVLTSFLLLELAS